MSMFQGDTDCASGLSGVMYNTFYAHRKAAGFSESDGGPSDPKDYLARNAAAQADVKALCYSISVAVIQYIVANAAVSGELQPDGHSVIGTII